MPEGIKIASVYADLQLDSGHLERGLANGRAAMAAIDQEIKQLQADVARGAIDLGTYNDRWLALNQTMATVVSKMQAAYAAVNTANGGLNVTAQGMNSAADGSMHFSMALMQLGAAVDDVQYGFKGILNNIPMIVSGFAQAAGATGPQGMAIAGGVAIATTAIYQLIQHWDEVRRVFGLPAFTLAKAELEELTQQMDEAASAAMVVKQIAKDRKDNEKMMAERPEEEEKAAKAWKDALKESDHGKMLGSLMEVGGPANVSSFEKEMIAKDVYRDNPIASFYGQGHEVRQGIEAEIERKVANYRQNKQTDAAQRLMREAGGTGNNAILARRQIKQMMTEHRDLFTDAQRANVARAETGKTKKEAEAEAKVAQTKADAAKKKEDADEQAFDENAQHLKDNWSKPYVKGIAKGAIGDKLRAGGTVTTNDIRAQMIAGGATMNQVDALSETVAQKLKEAIKNEMEEYAAEHGVSQKEAGQRLNEHHAFERDKKLKDAGIRVREAGERVDDMRERMADKQREHNKPQWMGLTDYAKKLAIGGFETDKYEREMLKMQRELKDATDNVAKAVKEKAEVALAGR